METQEQTNDVFSGFHKQAETALKNGNVSEFNRNKEAATELAKHLNGTTAPFGFVFKNIDLSGKDLKGIDLESCDISGSNCKGTDFSWGNLRCMSAIGADFEGAKFDKTDVSYANFHNAYLLDLTNAIDDGEKKDKKETKTKKEKASARGTHIQKEEDLTLAVVQNFFANFFDRLRKRKPQIFDREYPPTKIDPAKMDWPELKKQTGIDVTKIKDDLQIEHLLNGKKTGLIPIFQTVDGKPINTHAKLSIGWNVEKQEYDKFQLNYVKQGLDLDKPYYGYKFTEEDKKNLLETGNLGKVIDISFKPGEQPQKRFVSLDFDTKEIISSAAEIFNKQGEKIPLFGKKIMGIDLEQNPQIKEDLESGKRVYVEGLKYGNHKGNAYLQYNASAKQMDFDPDKELKKKISLDGITKEMTRFNKPDQEGYFYRDKEFTKEHITRLSMGESLLVDDLKTKDGHAYSAFISYDFKNRRLLATSAGKLERSITATVEQEPPKQDETTSLQQTKKSKGVRR